MSAADAAFEQEATRLLHEEARLLDAGRFADWLELFTTDGIYWIPSRPGQTDPLSVPSIIYEDRDLLSLRVRRLAHPRAHVLSPLPQTLHLIGTISLPDGGAAEEPYRLDSALIVVEQRGAEPQRLFAGRATHHLRRVDGLLRIALKRIDLLGCDGILGVISLPL